LYGCIPAPSDSHHPTRRSYPVHRLEAPPDVDGVVDGDSAWSSIPRETAFVTPWIEELGGNLPAFKQSSFRIGYTSEAVFLAFVADEPWTRYLDPDSQESDSVFAQDDGLEVFLLPSGTDKTHHFVVNANGNKQGSSGTMEWDDWEWQAASRILENQYVIEVRIPLEKLNGPDASEWQDSWSGNVVRFTNTIISPEDRYTSWSPAMHSFAEPEGMGRLWFSDELLTSEQARALEEELTAGSAAIMESEEALFSRLQEREDALADDYRERVDRRGHGFLGVTKGAPDLIEPPDTPSDETWRYGVGFPMQISPTEGAVLTNIRLEGSGNIDFEIGTDVIIFDDLDEISAERAIPISRYDQITDPIHGNLVVRKGPVIAGFVPVGALLEAGSPHPGAGTGFGIGWAISHKIDDRGKFDYLDYVERYAIQYQFEYDGDEFRVLESKRIDAGSLLPDWNLVGNFVQNGIPDASDILYVMIARVDGVAVAGVTRWRYGSSGWTPISFAPVTGYDVTWSEPSLVREADGSLLFSARSYDRAVPVQAFDIGVWKSSDGGMSWERVVHERNRRSRSPVSINRTVDGTPLIAANIPPVRRTREVLAVWPLNDNRTGLEGRITVRNAPEEFGPAPSGSWWRIDHPNSAIIRLADGHWHSVLVYRIVDNGEVEGDAPPTAQTGCYVEEVLSAGDAVAPWRFATE
jgi:hypothetical protein